MNKYMIYPVNWVAITTYFSNYHYALDYGWNNNHGGKNVGVYAVADGKVFDIGKSTGNNNAGNYVWTRHEFDTYDILTRYAHLQDGSIKVKVGQSIKQGQQIANMGGTYGYSEHLHHDVWKVPKGYVLNWKDRSKYSVNPANWLVLSDNQTHGENAKGVMSLLGTSKKVARDTSKDQIEVIGYQLRCRSGAGTNQAVLGYIDYGIYNYTETKVNGGYTWYNVGFGWIAGTKEDTKIYTAESPEDGKDKKIAELEEQVKKLDTELLIQKKLVEKQKEEIDQLNDKLSNYANLKEHNVDKTEYIKLINGDRIYF